MARGIVVQNQEITAQRKRIPSLDGLRAISIILVIFDHFFMGHESGTHRSFAVKLLYATLGNGEFGVEVFFVISGFLITYLLLREREKNGCISLKDFYIRRFFRIFPAYYTLIAVVAILSALGIFNATRRDLIHAATYTWIYNFHDWNWYLAHSWSLGVEEQFYLFWPAVVAFMSLRYARRVAFAMLLLVPAARALFPMPGSHLFHHICYFLFAGRFDVLMCGCLAALYWRSERLQGWLRSRYAGAICVLALVIAFCVSSAKPFIADGLAFRTCRDSIVGIAVMALLLYVISNPKSIAGKALNFTPLAWVGTISYSLYLWQQLFLTPDSTFLVQRAPFNIPLAFLAAVLSFNLIERPMVRLRERMFAEEAKSEATAPEPLTV
ncbi:acyltransferase family protein [Silvibacterium dinghuense]|nr:acyltransferase [Silvibacterium dinghuense]